MSLYLAFIEKQQKKHERKRLAEKRRRNAAWAQWFKTEPKAARMGAQAMYDHPDDRGQTHKDEPREGRLAEAQQLDGYIRGLTFASIRKRAQTRGIPFNLVRKEDLKLPKKCEVLGIPLFYSGAITDNTPSVDRITPSKGYVRGNIRVISMRANRLKQDSTLAEAKALVAYLVRHGAA